MIDFNKIEEFVRKFASAKSLRDVPYQPFIFRNEIITIEDIKKVVQIFKNYYFDKRNIARILERRGDSIVRCCGQEKGFLYELVCSNCGKKFLVEDFAQGNSVYERFPFFLHFFDIEKIYSYKEGKDCQIEPANWKAFKDGTSREDVYLCKDCYETLNNDYLERTKEEREQRKIEIEKKKAEEEKKRQEALAEKEAIERKEKEIFNKKVQVYIDKYKNHSFDFYDTIGLFLKADNNEENVSILQAIMDSDISMLDFMKVAFEEPQMQEKKDYICGYYSFDSYHDFFKTPYWQIVTLMKKEIRPNCEFCGSTEHLNVHHKEYQGVHGAEHLEENIKNKLVCLCNNCHKKVHKIISVH